MSAKNILLYNHMFLHPRCALYSNSCARL